MDKDYFGWSPSLNYDGSIVAIGAFGGDGQQGYVKVYNYENGGWHPMGLDIPGEAANDRSGYSVSLNSNASSTSAYVAIGAYKNDPNNLTDGGHVKVYKYNGSIWTQLEPDIDGTTAGENSGLSVSLNASGTRVAFGAHASDNKRVLQECMNTTNTAIQIGSKWDLIFQEMLLLTKQVTL